MNLHSVNLEHVFAFIQKNMICFINWKVLGFHLPQLRKKNLLDCVQ